MSDSTEPEDNCHAPADAIAAFQVLSDRERANIMKAARFLTAQRTFTDPKELVSEAYVRIANGERTWRRGQSFVTFVGGVMRSLASSDVMFITEAKRARNLSLSLAAVSEDEMNNIPDDRNPETAWGKGLLEEVMGRLESRFENDYEMRLLIEGIMTDGLNGKELEDAVGVDTKRLAALRTRFNREVDKIVRDIRGREGLSS